MHCGLRGLDPDTLYKTYLPGIAATLDLKRAKCAVEFRKAMACKEVKMVLEGFRKRHEKQSPKAERIKMPYGLDLALRSRKVMYRMKKFEGNDKEILMKRIFVCQVVGITFLLRRSEHIVKRKQKDAPLLRRHLTFFDRSNKPIKYEDIGKQAHKASSVTLNVIFSKTDQSGYGRRTSHMSQPQDPETCTVSILENWISETRDKYSCKEEDGLYFLPGYGRLGTKKLHEVMQLTVEDCGLKKLKKPVTSHSLRYGGATMLAAAGLPHYIIAIYGGWTQESKSLRIYTKPSDEMTRKVSRYMARMARED